MISIIYKTDRIREIKLIFNSIVDGLYSFIVKRQLTLLPLAIISTNKYLPNSRNTVQEGVPTNTMIGWVNCKSIIICLRCMVFVRRGVAWRRRVRIKAGVCSRGWWATWRRWPRGSRRAAPRRSSVSSWIGRPLCPVNDSTHVNMKSLWRLLSSILFVLENIWISKTQ